LLDQFLQIQIKSNIDLSAVTFEIVESPKNGAAKFGTGGRFEYQPLNLF
jgi:hypothetical protein